MDKCPRCNKRVKVKLRHPDFVDFNIDLKYHYYYKSAPVGEHSKRNKLFTEFLFGIERHESTYREKLKLAKRFKEITDESKKTAKWFICEKCGFEVRYERLDKTANLKDTNLISSGDKTLDELLSGGINPDLVYILCGDKKLTTNILLTTSVIVQKTLDKGGLGEGFRVAFVDGNNRFNPYYISKFAVAQYLSPLTVLENILISRAFTFGQIIEILENKLSKLEDIKVVLISGITCNRSKNNKILNY